MPGWTNRGKANLLRYFFTRDKALPDAFWLALIKNTTPPGPDTNVLGDLEQIAVGGGYIDGGQPYWPGGGHFAAAVEDDTDDLGSVELVDISFGGEGDPVPVSGDGAWYVVLTDNNPTVADREVFCYWSLGEECKVTGTQMIVLSGTKARATE